MQKGNLESDSHIHDYVLTHSVSESDVLLSLRRETMALPDAIMQIPPDQGQFMSMLIKLLGARRAIEVGVFTGYSTLCVAQAMPADGYIVACDVNQQWTDIAKKYWAEARVASKIDLRLAPAKETLQALIDDGQSGTFDFIFIDADKLNYDIYYEQSLQLLRPGGLMAIDNVLLFGSVIDSNMLDSSLRSSITEESIQTIRDLNIKIKDDKRVDMTMLKIADGLSLARKK